MIRLILTFSLLLLAYSQALASTPPTYVKRFPSDTPVEVAIPSDISGSSGWTRTSGKVILTNPSDNVGIGSSSPKAALDVGTGTIIASNIVYPPNGDTSVNGSHLTQGLNSLAIEGGNDSINGSSSELLLSDGGQAAYAGGFAQLRWDDTTGYINFGDVNLTGNSNNLDAIRVFQNAPGKGFLFGNGDLTNSTLYFGINGDEFPVSLPNQYAHNMSIFAEDNDVPAFNGNIGGNLYIGSGYGSSGYGNIGIGTSGGNVGIGSVSPRAKLDVRGTVNAIAFVGDGSGLTNLPANGGWTLGASNVGISTTNNVGIGTNLTTNAGLSIMNGNVGIGTWKPVGALDIKTGTNVLVESGNVGIGTATPGTNLDVSGAVRAGGKIIADGSGSYGSSGGLYFRNIGKDMGLVLEGTQVASYGINVSQVGTRDTATVGGLFRLDTRTSIGGTNGGEQSFIVFGSPTGGSAFNNELAVNLQTGETLLNAFNGNTGIGLTATTGATKLDVNGAVRNRTTTEIDGNVGIGTSLMTTAALSVMNGNIGVGTWKPVGALDIKTGNNVLVETGNVGIGSLTPGLALDVTGTIRASGFSAQASGTILCVKTGGGIGFCSGVIAGISCTCN